MDNGRNKRTLEFDLADLPMVAHALHFEYLTHFGGDPDRRQRAKELHAAVAALVPRCSNFFDAGAWQAFCRRISEGEPFEVSHRRAGRSWESKDGQIVVTVGSETWKSERSDFPPETPAVDEVRDFLTDYAPLPSVGPRP